jgi:tetratricopeptide (TPR) repeat protein
MIQLAYAMMFLWIPIVVGFFSMWPAKKAVVVAFIFAWLFLPALSFDLPGLPDYSKVSATSVGVLLSAFLFAPDKVFGFRFRWYDVPMVVWCLCPIPSSMLNGLGIYEGLAASLEQIFYWGISYFIGRVFLSDLDGLRLLALGITVGGLAYVPFCLVEIRLSPQFNRWVYGIYSYEGTRYGGFRPSVFLGKGLELGMWMTCASLMAYRLWASQSIQRLFNWPFKYLALGLGVTTVLCKSTGALLLLIVGIAALWVSLRLKARWPIYVVLAVAPFYVVTRSTGLWAAQEPVEISRALFGEERAHSLDFRITNENLLTARAMQHPVFGFGRYPGTYGTYRLLDEHGKDVITDGYWILALGINGYTGVFSMILFLELPIFLLMLRYPVRTWAEPDVAPAAALGILLPLYMIDNLSNAMPNPIYGLIAGALIAVPKRLIPQSPSEIYPDAALAEASELAHEGHHAEAERMFLHAASLADNHPEADTALRGIRAEAREGLALSLRTQGRLGEAIRAARDALAIREWVANDQPTVGTLRDLALGDGLLGKLLTDAGKSAEAVESRRKALSVWDALVSDHPDNVELRGFRIAALNDLAWLLASAVDAKVREPAIAIELASEAVALSPTDPVCWNTLGVARLRGEALAGAAEALEHAIQLQGEGGTGYDHFFLAITHARLDDPKRARYWYDRGISWLGRETAEHPDLARYRREALAMLREEA